MEIEFSTSDKVAADYFYPVPANKMIPQWYKDTERYLDRDKKFTSLSISQNGNHISQTVKACLPVRDYITSGYIIRASADIVITPDTSNEIVSCWWSSSEPICGSHTHEQCPVSINKEKHIYFKIKNPWCVKTPSGYSSYFYQPEFFFNDKLRLFPGIVDTDDYPENVNFVGIVITKESFIINAGDPLMVVFPFKRESWEHKVKHQKETTPSVIARMFERGYQKLFHKQKRYQ